jgi:hypothetical protein
MSITILTGKVLQANGERDWRGQCLMGCRTISKKTGKHELSTVADSIDGAVLHN